MIRAKAFELQGHAFVGVAFVFAGSVGGIEVFTLQRNPEHQMKGIHISLHSRITCA